MKVNLVSVAVALFLVLPLTAVAAAPLGRIHRVEFAPGATATAVDGRLTGYEFVDYRLRAGAGQTLAVTLESPSPSTYFNLLPPGSAEVAMFIGSNQGGRFAGVLPADGDYTVRVYQMRAAARRKETARYTLTVAVTGTPLAAVPAAVDALIPGTPFHASAPVACAPAFDPQARQCQAFVVRRGFDGTATVELRSERGTPRRILFVKGVPVAADATVPPVAARQGDATVVTFGADERYEIPDALLFGG